MTRRDRSPFDETCWHDDRYYLGTLGRLDWYRCRHCGHDFEEPSDEDTRWAAVWAVGEDPRPDDDPEWRDLAS